VKKLLILITLMAISTAHSDELESCSNSKEFICNEEELSHSVSLAQKIKITVKENFNNRGSLSDTEKISLQKKIKYLTNLSNQIGSCEKLLFGSTIRKRASCSLNLIKKKKLSKSIFITSEFKELRILNGKCQEAKPMGMQKIINQNGDYLAYSLKGRWVISNSPNCKTQNGENTERNIQLGGVSKEYSRDAYIFIIDLSESDKYYNSTFRARRVSLKDSELEILSKSDDLVFQWSNGAYIKIDSKSSKITESNLLSESSITEQSCSTKKYYTKSKKPRMIPEIELTSEFSDLKITSPLNR
jgi:hypothetical protein